METEKADSNNNLANCGGVIMRCNHRWTHIVIHIQTVIAAKDWHFPLILSVQ
jgi:hypothetical protein